MRDNKPNSHIKIGVGALLGLAVLVFFASQAGTFFDSQKSYSKGPTPENPEVYTAYTSATSSGAREYKNLLLNFDVVYPGDLNVLEYNDGTSASTLTFQNQDASKGFQVFAIPYALDYISEEQIKKDIPGGVITDLVDIVIDGVPASMFFSTTNGITLREVWFIHDGFLFEVTTPQADDEWLSRIMATWKFL